MLGFRLVNEANNKKMPASSHFLLLTTLQSAVHAGLSPCHLAALQSAVHVRKIRDFPDCRAFALSTKQTIKKRLQAVIFYCSLRWHCSLLFTLYHTFLMFCIDFETFCSYAVSNSQMVRMNQIFAKEDLILKFFSGKEKKHTAESNDDLIERLLLENYNRYYHLAYSYVHNPDDASDIVQNGAYLAIKNSASLRQPEYAATWIYRIMLNEIFRHLKRPDTLSYEDSLITEGKPDRYQDLDLRAALDSLSPEDKAIVELRYFEDLKIEDIARVLDENVNTVKSRLYRSMQKLKLKMEVAE